MRNFSIVVGVNNLNGIGYKGKLPWKNYADMSFFKTLTTSTNDTSKLNAIIMGRNTFESMNEKPLTNRLNYIITNNKYHNVSSYCSLDECLKELENKDEIEKIYVIGGGRLYKEAIRHVQCENIFLNKINNTNICDTFFPVIPDDFIVFNKLKIDDNVTSYLYLKNIL
jgi:dihydrofolate reductase